MQIQINYGSVPNSDTVEERLRERIERDLGRFGERLTRIEAHLGDVNSDKAGSNDKRCMLEARPRGLDPIAVEERANDLYVAIAQAAKKLERVLTRTFEKLDESVAVPVQPLRDTNHHCA